MKVIEIIDTFPKISETFILREILAMQKKGVDIEVFAFKNLNEKVVHPEVRGVRKISYFPKTTLFEKIFAHFYWFFTRPLNYLIAASLAVNPYNGITRLFLLNLYDIIIVMKRKPDHIHAHWTKASDFSMLTHIMTNIPFSFTTHRSEIFDFPPKNYKIKSKLAKKHVTVTEYNRRFIVDKFGVDGKEIVVIHSALDFTKKYPVADSKGEDIIITIARLEKIKGLDVLIRACSLLKKEKFEFKCLIAGDGSERENLDGLIKELGLSSEVFLVGNKNQEEILKLLSSAKMLVLPSRSESLGNVFTEARACRVPVIGPRVLGVPEVIHDGIDGFLVEPDHIEMLADKIKILLTNEPLREQFIEKGYEKAFKQFNIDRESDKLLEIWMN